MLTPGSGFLRDSRRLFALGIVLGVVIAVAGSCGPKGPTCKASNCAGCCDANGECRPGSKPFACGARAEACVTCAEACVDAVCQTAGGSDGGTGGGSGGGSGGGAGGGAGACSITNCNGCCDSTGTCRGGNTNQLCGKQAANCAVCPGGQSCQMNACAAFTSCPSGCKDGTGACQPGTADAVCGSGGSSCVACPSGQTCSGGACASPCNATTCGSGCCDGTTCVGAPTALKCGINGSACAACTGTMSCQGGICQAGTGGGGGGAGGGAGGGGATGPCGPTTCAAGCCAPDPFGGAATCQPGNDPFFCGKNGATCMTCSNIPICYQHACL